MTPGRIMLVLSLAVILGVPFAMSFGRAGRDLPDDAPTLIVITPHVQQIRSEFARAFSEWHAREHGSPVEVVYLTPGGTSEIRKQLEAQYKSVLKNGDFEVSDGEVVLPSGAVGADLFFGGGSYDHGQVARGVSVAIGDIADPPAGLGTVLDLDDPDASLSVPMSEPAGFEQAELDALFGENSIGPQFLYDPDQYWIGTALSSFGIVYNIDVYERLGLPLPTGFEDLTRPELRGWVALADPRQSGSITTTFDSILGNHGWEDGWRILRGMCGNTRYFTNMSTKPPTDVSQGEAAAGLAIDFYGRGQAQTAGRGRVGYVDPAGAVYIDADPISILRGAPHPELARRFLRFALTEKGQSLWQFHATDSPEGAGNPSDAAGVVLGPIHAELRRMPVRRVMYETYFEHFMDKVVPFEIASDVQNPGWRTGVQVMMGCYAIDIADECRAAWDALCDAQADPDFPADVLAEMERLFYAWPTTPVDESGAFTDSASPARRIPWTEATYRDVRNSWRPTGAQAKAEIYYTRSFRRFYRAIVRMADERVIVPGVALGASSEAATP
ncbi:MAG: extracellular solute-binding protein [Phycisphaerales bacterium]